MDYIDVSPRMMVSVGHGHDPLPGERRRQPRPDGRQHAAAGRAAAASPRAPIVGTGMEYKAAWTPRCACWPRATARSPRCPPPTHGARMNDGGIERLPADQVYALQPRAPASTRRPSSPWASGSRPGRSSWPTAPPPSNGEIALGKNILIGFMTWEGYNYEDAVLLNEQHGPRRRVHLHPHRGV